LATFLNLINTVSLMLLCCVCLSSFVTYVLWLNSAS